MTDRLFFDTNVLIYAMERDQPTKRTRSVRLIQDAFVSRRLVVSPQTLNECYRVLVHKRRIVAANEARAFLSAFSPVCTAPLDLTTHHLAYGLEDRHKLSWWDCVMLASAIQAGCRYFLSEDMQHGREVEGLRILDPFEASFDHLPE